LFAGGAYLVAADEPTETFCTTEAMIGPEGKSYGRSHDHGCQFVDEDGELVLTLSTGEPICYEGEAATVVSCNSPGARRPG
jgi:hypothetical protein